MGNYISCAFITPPSMKSSRVARVIFPGGEIKQFREPVNAAELMLECPSHFLASSRSLHVGRRFSALGADEELELGDVYIMFPMRRVNSVVAAGDMAVMLMAASSGPKRISGAKVVRVSPEGAGAGAAAEAKAEDETRPRLEEVEGFPLAEYSHRLAVCRSRRPLLETIKEEAVLSR
ncbi:uncharacterized protein LOC115756056 [Rhodamnia argentea]|uniref:Uncharacterized protein LOC115756056 n=1 Tax=Rhodamnia argentea TaxID=178133 RepID=A0A8B8QZ82_9MYRT|nr:uncharacterized protein LOC115756056 [Rhodamnia argentea]